MNILVFTASFHPYIGGLETHTLSLVYEFLKKGYHVKVIAIQFQDSTPKSATPLLKDVEVHYRPGRLKTLQLYLWCNIMFMPNISLRGMWLLLFNPFKKLVISHNDSYLNDTEHFKTKLKLRLLRFARHNISVSKNVANHIKTKSTVIFNCYDDVIFKIHHGEERVYDFVFLGRLVSQKGCDFLIKALSNVGSPFSLNIIGDGTERPMLEEMVQQFGLQDKIKFLGILEGEHLARTLNRHRVIVIPSLGEEGFGIVALEGMACGCKVIAADAGGLVEAVNGFGKIFTMGDQAQLELLLKNELTAPDNKAGLTMTDDVIKYLSEHDRQAIAEKYIQLFK